MHIEILFKNLLESILRRCKMKRKILFPFLFSAYPKLFSIHSGYFCLDLIFFIHVLVTNGELRCTANITPVCCLLLGIANPKCIILSKIPAILQRTAVEAMYSRLYFRKGMIPQEELYQFTKWISDQIFIFQYYLSFRSVFDLLQNNVS